jgi:hypothetical protein
MPTRPAAIDKRSAHAARGKALSDQAAYWFGLRTLVRTQLAQAIFRFRIQSDHQRHFNLH